MRIKEHYSRQQLEQFPVSRIKRTFLIPRSAKFTKMKLIDKIMNKMEDIFPASGLELKEKLENTKWQDLKKEYTIPRDKGVSKEKAIEMIMSGEIHAKMHSNI